AGPHPHARTYAEAFASEALVLGSAWPQALKIDIPITKTVRLTTLTVAASASFGTRRHGAAVADRKVEQRSALSYQLGVVPMRSIARTSAILILLLLGGGSLVFAQVSIGVTIGPPP